MATIETVSGRGRSPSRLRCGPSLPRVCWSAPMEILATIIRYTFVAVLAVEAVLVGRALVGMVLEKARAAAPPAAPAEE